MTQEWNSGVYQKIESCSDPAQPEYIIIVYEPSGDLNFTYLNQDKNIIEYVYGINLGNEYIAAMCQIIPENVSNHYSYTTGKIVKFPLAITGISHGVSIKHGEYYSTHTNFSVFGKCYYSQVFIFKNGYVSSSQYIKIK